MTSLVEVRLERLPRRLEQRRGILEKRDAQVMRTGGHGHTNLQVSIQKRIVTIGGSPDRHRPDRAPIEQQPYLVRLQVLQAVDVARIAAREVDLDVVLAVLRERVTN